MTDRVNQNERPRPSMGILSYHQRTQASVALRLIDSSDVRTGKNLPVSEGQGRLRQDANSRDR